MRRRIPALAVLVLAVVSSIGAIANRDPKAGAVSSHIVIISVDGLRPDAIAKYNATTLLKLRNEGAAAAHAQTIFPSKTLPSHASMVTGVTPAVHGITWNSDKTGEFGFVKVETVFELAKNQGFTTAGFFSKAKFHHLMKPGTLDYAQAPRGDNWMSTKTVADVQQYLRYNRPNVL